MTAEQLRQLESRLWKTADDLKLKVLDKDNNFWWLVSYDISKIN